MNADKFQFSPKNPFSPKSQFSPKIPLSQHNQPTNSLPTNSLPTNSLPTHSLPKTWMALIEEGDGYLTPAQRQAFDQAILMVTERLQKTLGKSSTPAEQAEYFDFSQYIDTMEDRFLDETQDESELQQDVSLAAARIIQHIAHLISH